VNHRRVPAPLILAQEAHVVVGDRRTGIEPGRGLVLPLRRGRFAQREEDDAQARVGVAYAGKPLVRFDEEGATAVRSPVSASSRRPARASACPRSTRNGPWVGHCVTARRSRGTADPTRPCDSRTAPRASSQVIRVTGMYSPRSLVVQAQQSCASPSPRNSRLRRNIRALSQVTSPLLRAGTNVKEVASATTAGTVSCQRRLAG